MQFTNPKPSYTRRTPPIRSPTPPRPPPSPPFPHVGRGWGPIAAALLRIHFWWGREFDFPLMFQSVVMLVAQMVLLWVRPPPRTSDPPGAEGGLGGGEVGSVPEDCYNQ